MALSKIDVANMLTGLVPNDNTIRRPNAKPIIINGSMDVSQRATSTSSITSDGFHTLDRFETHISSLGTWTQSQDTDVPSGQGFANSLKMDVTSADASPGAGDFCIIRTKFEGQDLQLFKKGTSSAEKFTLAFWVKSSKTGTHIVELFDIDNTRTVSQAYTISSADTWEKKVVNFPADTTGAFGDDNGRSLDIQFWLGTGTTYSSGTLQTTWAGQTNANRAVGQVNLADNTSNNWYITGVQLEVGEFSSTTIPPFQHESFADNLARCKRYFETQTGFYFFSFQSGTNVTHNAFINCKVEKRDTPTGTYSGSAVNYYPNTGGGNSETNNVTAITIGDKNGSTFLRFDSEGDAPTDAGFYPIYADARNAVANWDAEL